MNYLYFKVLSQIFEELIQKKPEFTTELLQLKMKYIKS